MKAITRQLRSAMVLLAAIACSSEQGATAASDDDHDAAPADSGAVQLDSTALAMSDIRIGTAGTVTSSGLAVTGTITYDQNRVSHIGPRTEGRIVRLDADLGARVNPGQVMAILESPEVGVTRAELHEAEALVRIQRENYDRERRLEAQGISSRKELLEAEAELRRAEAAVQSATERLRTLGAADGEGAEFAVVSPFAGIVVQKHATLGEVASSSDQLFTVADLSRVWIELDIFERDLARVHRGQHAVVTTAAWPGRTFTGRVAYLADVLDVTTRTVRARVEVDNPSRELKPGMFASSEIELPDSAAVVVVPREAVQDIEGRKVVWVPGGVRGRFVARPVEVGSAMADGRIRILAGLAAGDSLVVQGAFTLKAELSKSKFGGHGH